MKNKTDKITSTTEVKRGKAGDKINPYMMNYEEFLDWINSLFPEFSE